MARKPRHEELEQRVKQQEKESLERGKAEAEMALFRRFTEASGQGLGMADLEGRVIYANPTLCRFMGEEGPEDPLGKPVQTYYSEEDLPKLDNEILPAVFKKGQETAEIPLLSLKGELTPTIQNIFLIRNDEGEPVCLANVLTNITEHKRAERELQRHRDHLEELVAERTSDLRKTNERLQQEITERKQAKHALRESEAKYRALFDNAADLIAVVNPRGDFLDLNIRFEEESGYSREEMTGKNVFTNGILTKDSCSQVRFYMGRVLQDKPAPIFMVDGVRKDGGLVPYELRATPIKKDKQIVAVQAILRNITERKRAEEALRDSEARLRALSEASFEAIFLSQKGICLDQNQAAERIFGYTHAEAVGRHGAEWIVPEDRERVKNNMQSGNEEPYEVAALREDGTTFPCEIQARMIEHQGRSIRITALRDITDRKRAEEALRASEQRFRELAELLPVSVFELDVEGNFTYSNRCGLETFGYKREDLEKGVNALQLFIPEERKRVNENMAKRLAGEEFEDHEYTGLRKDSTTFPILVYSDSIIRDNEPAGLRGAVLDITDHKRAEEALRESEERYRALFESAAEGILVTDLETGWFKYANPAICRMLGYTEKELRRMGVADVRPEEALERVISECEAIARGERVLASEVPCLRKDGTTICVDIKGTKVVIDGRECNVSFFTDVTERKKAEEDKMGLEAQLQHAAKMEAIGVLAGGIAHDFNNLLMSIQGRASLMLVHTDSDHPHFTHLAGIEDAVEKGADLSKQLLGFARGGKYEVRATDLNILAGSSSEMFGRTKKEIKVHGKYQKDIWAVEVDRGQTEQVLLNLYVNAWQAMLGGGDLYLETKNVTLNRNFTKPFNLEPGNYVKLSVTDTGLGMAEGTRQRAFEPFFTTKEIGGGTGLGLASAYGIIKNHGGIIDVQSEPGHGTTIDIYLPASDKQVTEEEEFSVDVLEGTETVLLVDDEDMILEVGKEMVSTLGYNVMLAGSGKEAIELYKRNEDKIDIVVLDMIMPDMGGGEVYDRLKEVNPHIKALLSSGYSIDGQASEILQRGCSGFIQKPFNMKQLSSKLRRILDKQ